jgi:hypothetical protein
VREPREIVTRQLHERRCVLLIDLIAARVNLHLIQGLRRFGPALRISNGCGLGCDGHLAFHDGEESGANRFQRQAMRREDASRDLFGRAGARIDIDGELRLDQRRAEDELQPLPAQLVQRIDEWLAALYGERCARQKQQEHRSNERRSSVSAMHERMLARAIDFPACPRRTFRHAKNPAFSP